MTTTVPPLPEPLLEGIDYELWGQNAKTDCYTAEQISKRDAYWLSRLRAAEAVIENLRCGLADIATSSDMNLTIARTKAHRLYRESAMGSTTSGAGNG